jgi:hypothetical protein
VTLSSKMIHLRSCESSLFFEEKMANATKYDTPTTMPIISLKSFHPLGLMNGKSPKFCITPIKASANGMDINAAMSALNFGSMSVSEDK